MTADRTASVFAGFRFPSAVISLAVRWYPRYGLSCRDVEKSGASGSGESLALPYSKDGLSSVAPASPWPAVTVSPARWSRDAAAVRIVDQPLSTAFHAEPANCL